MSKKFYANILSIVFLTPLRAIVVVLAPIFPILIKQLFVTKIDKKVILLCCIIIISGLINILDGNINISSYILYIFICFPIIYLFFGKIKKTSDNKLYVNWHILFKYLRRWLIVIDIIGFLFRFIIFKSMDEFTVGYGYHYKAVTGLSVVNAYVLLYYFVRIWKGTRTKHNIYNLIFFFLSFISCFSGLVLLILLLTLLFIIFFNSNLKSLLRLCVISTICIISLSYIAKDVFQYNWNNILIFLNDDVAQNNARKKVMYTRSFKLISENKSAALIGVGPGGYNSRICFLLNNDSNNIFTKILGHQMPKYHKSDIYPLWNMSFVNMDDFTDGTRNQPFSSMVSFYTEIGFFFFLFFIVFWIKKIRNLKTKIEDSDYLYLYVLNIFVFLLFWVDDWFVSSEFILFIIINQTLTAEKNNKPTGKGIDYVYLLK